MVTKSITESPFILTSVRQSHPGMAKLVTKEAFECDPDFCPRCGSILPLPGVSDVVSCILCDFKKDASGNTSQRSFGF